MTRLVAIALLVAAAGITVIAVNGPGKDKPEKKSASAAGGAPVLSPQAVAAAGRPASTVTTVVLAGRDLEPQAVTVEPGQAVRFVNRDSVAHHLVEDAGSRVAGNPVLDARIAPGQSVTYTPREPAAIGFVCRIHPVRMIGLVSVAPAAS